MDNKFRASALIFLVSLTSQSVMGQTPAPPTGKPTAPGLIKLTGEDAKRAEELDKAIAAALKADHWEDAIARHYIAWGVSKARRSAGRDDSGTEIDL
jgi:hypothetical protein